MNQLLEATTTRTNPGIDPSLHIWGWEIVVYLFLGGLVAGIFVLAAALELKSGEKPRGAALRLMPFAALALISARHGRPLARPRPQALGLALLPLLPRHVADVVGRLDPRPHLPGRPPPRPRLDERRAALVAPREDARRAEGAPRDALRMGGRRPPRNPRHERRDGRLPRHLHRPPPRDDAVAHPLEQRRPRAALPRLRHLDRAPRSSSSSRSRRASGRRS